MRRFTYIGFIIIAATVVCESAQFNYIADSTEKRLWVRVNVPAYKGIASYTPGFVWTAKVRLFTRPAVWGTTLTNTRLRDLVWDDVRGSAEKQNPEAAYLLAHKLILERNLYTQAAYWLTEAANAGHGPAENDLGILAMFGLGVTRDMNRAALLFEKSASKGVAMAHLNAGLCSLLGLGCRQSFSRAKAHIRAAADAKLPPAEAFMAINHAAGTEIASKDAEKAYEYLLRARAHGAEWPLADGRTTGNWYFFDVDALEEYLEQRIPDRSLGRIQRRLSSLMAISPPEQEAFVDTIKYHEPAGSGVLVIGPEPVVEGEAEKP